MDYLRELRDKIWLLHGCEAKHRGGIPVKEVFRDKIVWEGDVEVFDLTGHPKAKRCYAWGYQNAKEPDKLDVVAVLEVPPVVSAETAVKAAIASHAKGTPNE